MYAPVVVLASLMRFTRKPVTNGISGNGQSLKGYGIINIIICDSMEDPEISEEYKKRLAMIRKEVRDGKYTDYKDTEELAKELGL